ncbi:hypothetical protein CPB83DRAFT_860967 [Crepidotus variabilis]|uniref:Uncharacterized protein n=1 Tax=Crepidotus variabilis TaxID=179855 RepID=A0A9P6JLC3_9AGAR|nr:hypothetical protein CPB83DRAFT_860967 [Crepidotus variabilis]
MNKLTKYLRDRKVQEAEVRFIHFGEVYLSKGWYTKTLDELDVIPATVVVKAEDPMETAVRMMRLENIYWELYCEHYGSEGTNRGQELHQQAYTLICEKLGPWSFQTKNSLIYLSRWDIASPKLARTLAERLRLVDMAQRSEIYYRSDYMLREKVALCCLRNQDYSDTVKLYSSRN